MTYRQRGFRGQGESTLNRQCSRPGCGAEAEATLTYDYRDRRAWIDSLADEHPMSYNLCEQHADGLSVPRGWDLSDRRDEPSLLDEQSTLAS
jgi:Protein of unknown function (DUF3499)